MNETSPMSTLPGGRIQCREKDGTLELHLPANRRGTLIRSFFLLLMTLSLGVVMFFLIEVSPWLLLPVLFWLVLSFFIFACTIGPHLMKTWITITRERLVLKTVVYGKEEIQKLDLCEISRAKKHYVASTKKTSSNHGSSFTGGFYQGIDISSEHGTVHFGDSLKGSEGEMDWIEWRINRFLDHATDADAPMAAMMAGRAVELAEPVAAPNYTKIRIKEEHSETRIHCPSTAETGSYKGISTVIFGLGCSGFGGFWLFAVVQEWGQRQPSVAVSLIAYCAMTLFGLMFLLVGLARLFGHRQLIISPEKITLRVTLLGIGPWRTLPTANVTSVTGNAIRTATSELRYGEYLLDAVRGAETEWIAGEIARRIHAARSG